MGTVERQSLADALDVAAGQIENGVDRLHVDESIRTAIARQPTSGQWAENVNRIIQAAHSPDPVVYANNLRLIAKGLRERVRR
jgi:hypothetical protein